METKFQSDIPWEAYMKKQDMIWEELPLDWDEGPFLGNGLMGAMLFWEKEHGGLRLEVCRADVTDHRDTGDMPVSFSRARLPIGHFLFRPGEKITGCFMRLDLYNARASGELRSAGGIYRFSCWIPRHAHAIIMETDPPVPWEWRSARAISPRQKWGLERGERKRTWPGYQENPPPYYTESGAVSLCVQPLLRGGEAVTAWTQITPSIRVITVAHTAKGSCREEAAALAASFSGESLASHRERHEGWWNHFYRKSFVSLPDPAYENFYWIQLYKLAAASRRDGVVIDNQGPWLWDTAWPYSTWNLNVQLTYWLTCPSNHTELAEPLISALSDNPEHLISAVPEKYRADSAAIDTVASVDCESFVRDPLEVNGQAEIANLPWALHNCWLVYRHTMDESILRRIYPIMKRAVAFLRHFLFPGGDGKYHFHPSASPEYGLGHPEDCNYTLALFIWSGRTLLDMSKLLREPLEFHEALQKELACITPYPVSEEQGFLIGRNLPYSCSHRHYSHLLMIYPLYLVNREGDEENAEIIRRSLAHWQSMPEKLRGYSCTGASSIASSIGDGNLALHCLSGLWDRFLRPNTMYKESGPVIETPLSAAQSILDMLLQSWGGKIRIFPATPDAWQDVCFDNLLAEGAFLVSARRESGKTQFVRVKSQSGGICRLIADFGPDCLIFCDDGVSAEKTEDGSLRVAMSAGKSILIRQKAVSPVIRPVEQSRASNCYGINRATGHVLPFSRTENYELE